MPDINTILGKYKGSNYNLEGKDVTCGTLKEINESNESLFENGNQNGKEFTEAYSKRKRKSHTFATMFVKNIGEIFETYSDLARRPQWFKERKIEGQNADDRMKKNADGEYDNTKLCADSDFKYNGIPDRLGGHTEARFLTELAGLGKDLTSSLDGKQIVFNILWQNKKGHPPNAPCQDCFQMMCKAEQCGATIEVCDPDGVPQKVAANCPGDYDGFLAKMKKIESQDEISNAGF